MICKCPNYRSTSLLKCLFRTYSVMALRCLMQIQLRYTLLKYVLRIYSVVQPFRRKSDTNTFFSIIIRSYECQFQTLGEIPDSAGQNMFRYQTFYSYQFQMNISQNTQMIFICSFSFRYSTPEPVAKTAIFFFEICHPIQIYMLFRCNSWHSGAVPDEES